MFRDASWLTAAGGLLLISFFLITGLSNLTRERIKDHLERMVASHTPFPKAVHWTGMTLLFIGCAFVLTGWQAEIGVYLLIFFIAAASVIFHRFWSIHDPMRRNLARLMLLNNIGMLGGLLLLLDAVQ